MNRKEIAQKNLELLRQNVYPGRGIICGMDESGQYLIQVYWIMGRSENSRNRIFIFDKDGGLVRTAPANPDLVKDPSLIIYTAMAEKNLRFVVSNGHQTMAVINGPANTGILPLLKKWSYEPDEPNFTPRITASIFLGHDSEDYTAEMVIFRKDGKNETCLRVPHLVNLKPGFGYCITTYSGDGNPLPSFSGQPYLLPLSGSADEILDTFWKALNEDNRVSLAVKFIDIATGTSKINVVNQYSQVEV
ncbi:MAG: inosine monophosphate cyclohydrolase [Candidatus Falkowbacteria bacterium]|nr:MAG: inosine monophosphate cyclohydrolase [Candidatus Falkowbacteria bacterium]